MIEVPSAALKIDAFLPHVDFVSIGTNDLTQYTLAAERGNGAVAGLSDALDPGVLRLIDHVCRAALGRWRLRCAERPRRTSSPSRCWSASAFAS
jgi:phosphocarrier protein FPr